MPPINKQRKPFFKIEFSVENIYIQFRRPKRKMMILVTLALFLIIVILIAINEQSMRLEALELVMTLIEAFLTFFKTGPKSK
jgi:uncharacterized integral membrane protein